MSCLPQWDQRLALGFLLLIPSTIFAASVQAELVINPALAITHRVTVQPVIVANDDGSNVSTWMGHSTTVNEIQHRIDLIWGQAGIDIHWNDPNPWQNTDANVGELPANLTRPIGDFYDILSTGADAGVGAADPLTISMYFVGVLPGHPELSVNSVAGFAELGDAGTVMYVGSNLPGFEFQGDSLGNDLVAKVIAHEIGHNLGLQHIDEAANLMLASDGFMPVNAVLNASQVEFARSSRFAVAIPEPCFGSACLIALFAWKRRRATIKRGV